MNCSFNFINACIEAIDSCRRDMDMLLYTILRSLKGTRKRYGVVDYSKIDLSLHTIAAGIWTNDDKNSPSLYQEFKNFRYDRESQLKGSNNLAGLVEFLNAHRKSTRPNKQPLEKLKLQGIDRKTLNKYLNDFNLNHHPDKGGASKPDRAEVIKKLSKWNIDDIRKSLN